MLKSTKITLTLAIIIVLAMSTWGYSIVKTRYFSQPSSSTEQVAPEISTETTNNEPATDGDEPVDVTAEPDPGEEQAAADDVTESEIAAEDNSFLEILPSDCKNGCKEFDEPEDIQYCKEYCGLVSTAKTSGDCGKFTDLEKDYCLKDEAIQKRDAQICTQIEDEGIKKSCRNRITEDILDAPTAQ
jgi:hypothetical protein